MMFRKTSWSRWNYFYTTIFCLLSLGAEKAKNTIVEKLTKSPAGQRRLYPRRGHSASASVLMGAALPTTNT